MLVYTEELSKVLKVISIDKKTLELDYFIYSFIWQFRNVLSPIWVELIAFSFTVKYNDNELL